MKKIALVLASTAIVLLSSCYSTTTCVGNMKAEDPSIKVNTVTNHHFIYGLVPGSNANLEDSKYIGDRKDYKVKKYHSFVNGLLEALTFGIYTPTTTVYYTPLNDLKK